MTTYICNPIYRWVERRVWGENKNYLLAIVGETGSGKSYAALDIAATLDPTFGVDRVCFDCSEVMKLINDGILTRGRVAILDETGVAFANRRWWTDENQQMGYLMQTLRHRNFILIMCLPSLSFMDKQGRDLIHAVVQTYAVDHKNNLCLAKYKAMQHNATTGKTYNKYPRSWDQAKTLRIVKTMAFNKPAESLIKIYEEKKMSFTKSLSEKAAKIIEARNKQANDKLNGTEETKPRKKALIESALKAGRLSIAEICRKYDTTEQTVYAVRRIMNATVPDDDSDV